MDLIFGIVKLSKEIGVSRPTIYNYIDAGLPCTRKGKGRYIFVREEVYNWLKSN